MLEGIGEGAGWGVNGGGIDMAVISCRDASRSSGASLVLLVVLPLLLMLWLVVFGRGV